MRTHGKIKPHVKPKHHKQQQESQMNGKRQTLERGIGEQAGKQVEVETGMLHAEATGTGGECKRQEQCR